jgi:MFS family permease
VSRAARPTSAAAEAYPVRPARAWLAVFILLLLTVVSAMDRGIISLMVDPIRRDLHITDVEVSLLQGLAFASFYAVFSLPMGWLADRYSRKWVIYCGATAWSIATVACGLAQSFGQLFMARIAVGAGEATLSPAAYGMVSDLFPKRRVALASSVLAAGAGLGSTAAFAIGGLVLQHLETVGQYRGLSPWQAAFVAVGAPGVLMAFLVLLIPRTNRSPYAAPKSRAGGYGAWLLGNAGYIAPFLAGSAFLAIASYGMGAWAPAYLSREFGLAPAAIGLLTGIYAIPTLLGYVSWGWLVDRLFAKGRKNIYLNCLIVQAVMITALGSLGYFFLHSVPLLVTALMAFYFFVPTSGLCVSHLQICTPPEFRSRTLALYMIAINFTGLAIGPTFTALLTEKVYGGPQYVGLSIGATFAVLGPLGILSYVLARGPARRALAKAERGWPDLAAARTAVVATPRPTLAN